MMIRRRRVVGAILAWLRRPVLMLLSLGVPFRAERLGSLQRWELQDARPPVDDLIARLSQRFGDSSLGADDDDFVKSVAKGRAAVGKVLVASDENERGGWMVESKGEEVHDELLVGDFLASIVRRVGNSHPTRLHGRANSRAYGSAFESSLHVGLRRIAEVSS